MPELPEVEVVRRGLAEHLVGHRMESVDVRHPRAVRRSPGGPAQVQSQLTGSTVTSLDRRGKFVWALLDDAPGAPCLLVHLGMSGQMLIKGPDAGPGDANYGHARVVVRLSDGNQLWFVDQRTFGYWNPCAVVDTPTGAVPHPIIHIARDLMDEQLGIVTLAKTLSAKRLEIKKLLLNQEIVSGIGNIYADEMLWAARIHPRTPACEIGQERLEGLLRAGREVMAAALDRGGTSFDSLYVNVNGASGYFSVCLNAYGQTGAPCPRCGTPIVREKFTNRSSHLCPSCQRLGGLALQ